MGESDFLAPSQLLVQTPGFAPPWQLPPSSQALPAELRPPGPPSGSHPPYLREIPVVQGHNGGDVALQEGVDEVAVEFDSPLVHLFS